MDTHIVLLVVLFFGLASAIMAGFPVAFTLAGVSLVVGLIGLNMGLLDLSFLTLMPERIYGTMQSEVLLAVPVFIAMGVMLEKSRIAEDLLEAMSGLFRNVRGGLGISIALVGALLAASTGIVGATVVTMGLLSLPTMLKRGYDPGLATGSIAAAGTLGQIIPPSIVLVLLADVLSSSWQQAQLSMGIFSPEPLSVSDLFAGALIPGLGLVLLYILYQVAMAIFKPESSPAEPPLADHIDKAEHRKQLLKVFFPPIILILAVLGSILAGVATPTEAAAVGAVGAFFLGALKLSDKPLLPLLGLFSLLSLLLIAGWNNSQVDNSTGTSTFEYALYVGISLCFLVGLWTTLRVLWRKKIIQPVMESTVRVSSMVYTILIGAALFSLVFRGLGGDELVQDFLTGLSGGKWTAFAVVMIVMFLLGFFLDFIEITFVVVPIVAPALLQMGIDPIWLGVMMAMNLQTSFLTPPFGFALFYLRGVSPDSIKTTQIYRGVIPFVLIQIAALYLLWQFPGIVTWLPGILG